MSSAAASKKRRWKRRDLAALFEQLEMSAAAGLPIDQSLDSARHSVSRWQSAALARAAQAIRDGSRMSRAIEDSVVVSPMIVGLIACGESSGSIARSYALARQVIEREDDIRGKCVSAMIYPAVIGACALALTLGLMRGVMPQITPLLSSLHAELPLLTRATMAVSDLLVAYGLQFVLAATAAAIAGYALYMRSNALKFFVHACLLRMPVIGSFLRAYAFSTFLRSCGALIDSGSSAAAAYGDAASVVGALPLRRRFRSSAEELNRGVAVSAVMLHAGMPAYSIALVRAGEESGALGSSLARSADIMDREIDRKLKRVTSLLEPLMMACMGCVVGAIAVSIMLPIYDLSKALQK